MNQAIATCATLELTILDTPVSGFDTMRSTRSGPIFKGHGGIDYVCGSCAATLCAGMREGQLAGAVLQCARCDCMNRVPGGKPMRSRVFPRAA